MVGPSAPDTERVAAIREALPAVAAGLYLNTSVAGPLPAESAAAMSEILDWEVRTGRAHRDRAADVEARVDEARAAVAAILATDLETVTLAHGLEDALAVATRSIDFRPGDRLALLDDPATSPVRALLPSGVEVVSAGETDRVRVLVLPLVRATTGERLPVEKLAAEAREGGIRTLVEVSLAIGAVLVDPAGLGADFLVARSEAWLLGPEGLAVVVGATRQTSRAGFHLPSVVGFARGCGWLSMYVGLPWIHARGAELTDYAASRLAKIAGVELLTPGARATTLVFRIVGWPAEEALDELGRRVFLLADSVTEQDALRIGLGAWNTRDEIDRLADAVGLLAAHTPENLPPRPRLTILGQGR